MEPIFGIPEPGVTYVDRPGAYGIFSAPHDAKLIGILRTDFGFFLPGGGLEEGETELAGLRREIFEEIGCQVLKPEFLGKATQYLYSRFYGKYFKKIASFYRVQIEPQIPVTIEQDHDFLWMPRKQAAADLTQEYQRWALNTFC